MERAIVKGLRTLSAENADELDKTVNQMIAEGWQPFDARRNIAVGSSSRIYQSMVKYLDGEKVSAGDRLKLVDEPKMESEYEGASVEPRTFPPLEKMLTGPFGF
jgi:hypothetical protein